MVSPRLIYSPKTTVPDSPILILGMIFARGEEPVVLRVLTYQSPREIKSILNALDIDEVHIIRESSFGKIVEIANKPALARIFGRYILSR